MAACRQRHDSMLPAHSRHDGMQAATQQEHVAYYAAIFVKNNSISYTLPAELPA
jgi:hypothetical protein